MILHCDILKGSSSQGVGLQSYIETGEAQDTSDPT